MITVTFPTGVRVTYNDANDVKFYEDYVSICYADENGKRFWRAALQRSAGCMIEWVRPCEVMAPPLPSPEVALDTILRQIESGQLQGIASWKLKDLKRALAKFNARSGSWRA